MSGRRAPHLKRRNGIYHLRMRVPDRLRERVGWQEVCKSLHTYSPTLARRLAASVSAKVLETFAMLDEITNVTRQEARMLLQACFADIQREIDRRPPHVPVTLHPDLEIEEQVSLAEECIARLRCENDHKAYSVGTKKAAEHALAGRGVDLKLISPEARALLLDGFCRLLIEEQRMSVARLQDPLADYQPADPLFSGSPAGAQLAKVADLPPLGITLGRAIQEYLNARKKVWQAKTHAARVVHLGYLADFLGPDRVLSDIEAADVRRFRNALSMLRANHGRKTHLTFHERLTENAEAKIKNKTARLIFEPIKAFFRWAKEDEGLIPANPAADVRWQHVADPKVTRTRRPFTGDELQRLFSSPLFSGCKSRYRRFEPGDVVIKDAKYWVPIIGYYTGMRLGEIIQLHVGDVVLDADVPHFDLNENYGSGDRKHIKTAAGVRKVPIHPDLQELGLADLVVQRIKWARPCKRLFSEIRIGSDGQASTEFSKFFARAMDKVGLSDPSLTFHSFRHGAEDAFRNANLQQYTIDAIMGHSDGKVSSIYGEGPSLQIKLEAVRKMQLPLKLTTLYTI